MFYIYEIFEKYGADFEENILVKDLDVIDGGQRGWADEPGVEILRSLPRLTLFNFWKEGILVDLAGYIIEVSFCAHTDRLLAVGQLE